MDLYLLAELKTIALKITTVDMLKPPPDFRSNFDSTPPPILIDAGVAVLENEKIERHIMKAVPGGHNLFVQVLYRDMGQQILLCIDCHCHLNSTNFSLYLVICNGNVILLFQRYTEYVGISYIARFYFLSLLD